MMWRFWRSHNTFGQPARVLPLAPEGLPGGIATFFASKYEIKTVKENQHWLLAEFKEKDDTNVSYVCNVYGPTHSRDKQAF